MRTYRICRNVLVGFLAVGSLGACGGGGGGSGSGNYAGIWDLTLTRVINDCNVNVPQTATNRVVVNQDGNRIVVDSGQQVLTGSTSDDDDGFSVLNVQATADGCESAASYAFRNASDGDADVGFALVVRCGNSTCTVGYGGRGIRSDSRDLEIDPRDENVGSLTEAVLEASALGLGRSDDRLVEVSSLEVAEAIAADREQVEWLNK